MARGRDWFLGFLLLAAAAVFIFFIAALFLGGNEDSLDLATGKRLGLVEVKGVILDSEPVVKELERFGEDKSIAAIILRIDSPGGGVAASQEIYEAVKRVRKESHKFVVASMASVAASGGYYVACGADTIIANPGTTTGSIGVIAELVNTTELLKKIGVSFEIVKSGKYKDSGTPWRPFTEEDRRYFQTYVDDAYNQFVEVVAGARNLSKEEVLKYADGRVFTGQQALNYRLIDALGTYQDAVALAAEQAGISGKARIVTPRRKRVTLFDVLFGDLEGYLQRIQTWPVLRYQMIM
ncbi:signal peptide peptidase SppA [candidate division KSB1 bacterium]|nr:signal peptide peptidase SppA [candidate division KSB1 bacterium]